MLVCCVNMEYDSESSCEGHLKDLEATEDPLELKEQQKGDRALHSCTTLPHHCFKDIPKQPNLSLHAAKKSLSTQVMEYYEKYSHSSNLDQYFSLPTSNIPAESVKYYYSVYELNSKLGNSRQDCIGEEYNLQAYVPRERRRWIRPPLIGQSSSTENSTLYIQPLANPQFLSPDLKHITPERISETKNGSQEVLLEGTERKISSPTSSVASHKPLEWDSGADVGYFNSLPHNKHNNKKLSTIERMALARGCSAALRLDPEGTTESGVVGKGTTMQHNLKSLKAPKASSTLITENISESESEIEITPIMKNMLPGIITGNDIKSEEKCSPKHSKLKSLITQSSKEKDPNITLSKSSFTFKVPSVKYSTEGKKVINKENIHNEDFCPTSTSLLKKSTSMNTIAASTSKDILKRSQSELNLYAKDKNKVTLPLIFNSTSSISTVVNKPATCDKVIQTSLNTFPQESVGIQVSVQEEEEKPPLPRRGTSLQKSLQSILKNPKNTYKIQNSRINSNDHKDNVAYTRKETKSKAYHSSSDVSQNESTPLTPQLDDTENITGRVNSFEYFPGHIYENVLNGSGSHVSSVDTGESNSTFPNTSSSLSEKLWGDSDSLVRDLERSVNILKSLVDANKCDKQVKKRLIHHVVKRLITARYADDKIEHNLEDNVPWNPDDARQKVYQAEILHALTKKHSTTASSDNWKTSTKNCSIPKSMKNDQEITQETLASSNSDKFDGNTDRTETDGRKARMGLRTDDCQQSSNIPTEADRSESSECFVPQQNQKGNKIKNTFCLKEKCKILQRNETTSTNSTPSDHNRMLLDAVVNRKTSTISSKSTENNTDWRFPTTLSERQFELKRCRNSNTGDLRLVSYAEMEKRNQLVWITNEISHLCNLKKLLEQPRRLERSKSSPRKSKSASFKTKPGHIMTHMEEKSVDTDSVCRDASNSRGNSIGEQWSSHCNLATCHSTDTEYTNNIQRTKKRNSSSQTATEVADAHSKTGGEIITTSKAQSTIKLVNTGVQTLHQEISTITTCTQNGTAHFTKCSIHKNLIHSPNKCKYINQGGQDEKDISQAISNTCLCCLQGQSQNPSIKNKCLQIPTNSDFAKEDSETSTELTRLSYTNSNSISSSQQTHCYMDKSKNQLKQKETKNQINASKSKYTQCNCQSTFKAHYNNCKCGINNINKKTIYQNTLPEICRIHTKQIPTMEIIGTTTFCELCRKRTYSTCRSFCICQKQEKTSESTSTTINGCTCTKEVNDEIQTNMFTIRSDRSCLQDSRLVADCNNQQKIVNLCGCSNSCENKLESEIYMPNASHETCSNLKTEYNRRYHSESCSKAERHQIHTRPYCLINTEENETSLQPKVQTRIKCNCSKDCSCPNKIKEGDNNHRTKHNTESNDVNGFNVNDSNKNCKCCRTCGKVYENIRKCNCRQTYPKSVAYEISFTKENSQKNISTIKKMPLSNTINDAVKSDKCTCTSKKQTENKNDKKRTLQDYLSKNKPEFVNNAETRRQYVSEIAHLRQLRKEKRIQLLAMASTSNSIKLPKSFKPTVNVQKRITDEEIKERLRKRYRRLNEVRVKRRQQERQEETRRNKLMAKIFCKKLQQKVLRGQVDLSQSVSVISNL
ncbi:hypothetical protein HZH68_002580 [Vespula germanica]|uniref:ALMS motif domain-containing protein n=1 Tax=Vespula germanica TaxID=30212 RepID=A0A834NMN8_VESGE|nr:hypothetical protein HZH68_002580 [Vespula germanica]